VRRRERRAWTDEERARAWELFREGHSSRAVASILGRPQGSIDGERGRWRAHGYTPAPSPHFAVWAGVDHPIPLAAPERVPIEGPAQVML
jgi:transposase-like protein